VTGASCIMRNLVTDIKMVMKLKSRRRNKNVARIVAILFRNLETRLRRRWIVMQ
jgi:hypothetical protein